MIEFEVEFPGDFRAADRITNNLTETFGASDEEIRLKSTARDEYRAIETAVLLAIVSVGAPLSAPSSQVCSSSSNREPRKRSSCRQATRRSKFRRTRLRRRSTRS
jgi:hypothetical protein